MFFTNVNKAIKLNPFARQVTQTLALTTEKNYKENRVESWNIFVLFTCLSSLCVKWGFIYQKQQSKITRKGEFFFGKSCWKSSNISFV